MFDGFARQWTPLATTARVRPTPRRIRLAGEDLVLWRAPDGEIGVLLDRCPHRGVSLSLGGIRPDGGLACGFHGWEFGPDGECRHLPFNPGARPERFAAPALPVAVGGGLVWVFTAFDPTSEELEGPVYSDLLDDPRLVRFDHDEEWACHWTRAMENMLDFPHLPYVHRTTIGRFVRAKMTRDSALHYDLEVTPYGFRFGARVDDHPPGAHVSWYAPHGMCLDTMPAPEGGSVDPDDVDGARSGAQDAARLMRMHVWCVPVDEHRTRMMLTAVRSFARSPLLSPAFDRLNVMILHQDRAIVESSDPPVVPPGAAERSVPTDRPTLHFRTYYHRTLAASTVADPRAT